MNKHIEFDGLPSLTTQYIRALLPNSPLQKAADPNAPVTLEASAKGVHIDADKLRQYAAITGFPASKTLPPTYIQVLAAPLHAALLATPEFPFPPLGLVHVTQRIHQIRPILHTERLDLSARIVIYRETPRGIEFDIETTAKSANQIVWQSTSTILVRSKSPKKSKAPKTTNTEPTPQAPNTPNRSIILRAPEDLGRRYAKISGDFNPIHLHATTARLFGFPRAIIHGMWSLARTIGELHDDITPENLHIYAEFRRPIHLPSPLLFTSTPEGDHKTTFTLHTPDQSKIYLTGHTHNQ